MDVRTDVKLVRWGCAFASACVCCKKVLLYLYFILYYFIRLIYNKKFSKMVRRSKRSVGSRRTRRHSRRHSRHSTRSRRVRRVHSRHTRGRRIHDVKIGGVGNSVGSSIYKSNTKLLVTSNGTVTHPSEVNRQELLARVFGIKTSSGPDSGHDRSSVRRSALPERRYG
jgi:hypothetical protein